MSKKNRDLVDELHDIAGGLGSAGTLDRAAMREIEDMSGELEEQGSFAMDRIDRDRTFVSLEEFLADLSDD